MRATLLTPKVEAALLEATRAGMWLESAAARAHVSSATVLEWLRRGEGRDDRPATPELEAFALKFREAEAEAEEEALATIKAARFDHWQAAAWWCERRHPSRYSARVQESVRSELDAMLDALESGLDPDVYRTVLGVLAKRSEENGGGIRR